MPLKQCSQDGKSGWKWGDSGACYTGPEGKKKALKQGQAIELDKKRRGEKSEFDTASKELTQLELHEFWGIKDNEQFD